MWARALETRSLLAPEIEKNRLSVKLLSIFTQSPINAPKNETPPI
jgi:hypothetical protein